MELKELKKEIEKADKIRNSNEAETAKKIQIILQNNNIKIGFFKDTAEVVANIWNKYKGKQAGAKTRQKIGEEIANAFDGNIFAYVYTAEYSHATSITILTNDTAEYSRGYKIELITKYPHTLINKGNTIQEISPEDLRECEAKEYTENTKATALQIIELHRQAEEKQEEINNICDKIRKLANYKIDSVKNCYSVGHWLV